MENIPEMERNAETQTATGSIRKEQIKYVSKEDEEIVLHDISKTTLAGMQSIDIVREYVENMDFKNYLDSLNRQFANINERATKYMSANKISSDFFGSLKQAFQRNAVKISMITSSSDRRIAEHMLRGANLGMDCIAKNLNSLSATLSPELLAMTKDLRQILDNSLDELRKYL